jgi:glucan endo-1,6-beta-glucosidase
MYLDAVDAANLISSGLGAKMTARNVKILAYDHNTDQPVYPERVIQGTPGHVNGVAWHCYQSPVANYSVLNDFHQASPTVPQFMTECAMYKPQIGENNFGVAANFMLPVRHGASGAAMWTMATDTEYGPHAPDGGCDGCMGSIIVNSSTSYTRTHDYYMIGQFSRFVRRGSVNYDVVEGNEGTGLAERQFYIVAVRNLDGSWAVVFVNDVGSEQDVVVSFTGGGKVWHGVVPNATVTTWLLPPEGAQPATYGNEMAAVGNESCVATS